MLAKKTAALLLAAFLVVAGLSGCSGAGRNQSVAQSFTDMTGREVSIAQPVTKVVALTAADCEIFYALGCGDAVVGRGEYCDYPAQALALPVVQSGADTNVEQIIALEPQVVFMSTMAQSPEQAAALEKVGIAALMTEAPNIEKVYEAIALIGGVMEKEREAQSLVDEMKATFAEVEAKVPATQEKKTVYFEISPLEYGLWTAGSGTFMDEIATMLGLENIFADVEDWGEISQEQVIARNPDYIVTVTMYFGEGLLPDEEIASREGWQDISAIREGNVIVAEYDSITRPGPRLVDAARSLYERVYGE